MSRTGRPVSMPSWEMPARLSTPRALRILNHGPTSSSDAALQLISVRMTIAYSFGCLLTNHQRPDHLLRSMRYIRKNPPPNPQERQHGGIRANQHLSMFISFSRRLSLTNSSASSSSEPHASVSTGSQNPCNEPTSARSTTFKDLASPTLLLHAAALCAI